MTRDEITQAFRLMAMGRVGHELQEKLVDKLVEVFSKSEVRSPAEVYAVPVVEAPAPKKREKKAD